MSKTKKQILLELLQLESDNVGDLGNTSEPKEEPSVKKPPLVDALDKPDDEEKIVAPKKKKELSEKQKEVLKRGQQIRDENARKRLEERARKEEEEKKIMEEKLVKKAIALKKKQLKKQQILDELSDDETPSKITRAKSAPPAPVEKSKEDIKPLSPYTFSFF